MQLVVRDANQGPFLTKVLNYARAEQKLSEAQLEQVKSKAVLMSLKFADKFYNKYKMHLLEQAAHDIIGVASLGLAELSEQDVEKALALLVSPEGIVKPFQKGWSMLSQVSQQTPNRKSLYGEVEEQLLQDIASPPDAEEWQGLAVYQQALRESRRRQAISVVKQTYFYHTQLDPFEHFNLEDMLAEVVLYRLCTKGGKVKQDLKQRLRDIELAEEWFDVTFLKAHTEQVLSLLPAGFADAVTVELGENFYAALVRTLQFAKGYKKLLDENASPERRDA
ncbi:cold adaptation protein AtcC, partial [Rheinheimera mesophila]